MNKYGIFLGRFQPFHLGHAKTVEYILKDGLIPVIFIGSVDKNDNKNPLNFETRKKLIQMVFPHLEHIYPLKNNENWDIWMKNLKIKLNSIDKNGDFCFYSFKKDNDIQKFKYKNNVYIDNYQKIFELENFKIKNLKPKDYDKIIHATDIRKNKKYAKQNLNNKIFKWLEKHNFWDS